VRGANGELLDEEEQLRLAIEASLSNVVAAPPAPPAQPLQAAIVVPDTLDPDAFDDSFTTPAVSRPRTTVAVAAGRAAEHRRAAGQPTPAPPTGRRLAKRILSDSESDTAGATDNYNDDDDDVDDNGEYVPGNVARRSPASMTSTIRKRSAAVMEDSDNESGPATRSIRARGPAVWRVSPPPGPVWATPAAPTAGVPVYTIVDDDEDDDGDDGVPFAANMPANPDAATSPPSPPSLPPTLPPSLSLDWSQMEASPATAAQRRARQPATPPATAMFNPALAQALFGTDAVVQTTRPHTAAALTPAAAKATGDSEEDEPLSTAARPPCVEVFDHQSCNVVNADRVPT